jgi:hypothetical protein
MTGKVRTAVVTGVVITAGIAALVAARGCISSSSYRRTTGKLSSSMSADLQSKYGEELDYTIDKFWDCYEAGICSRNDMTDVMDEMKRILSGSEITDRDIFDFIGFVSRIYTNRLEDHHRKTIRRMEEDREAVQ